MIRTLDRYLLRAFVLNYMLSLFVLISLYVVLDLFVNFDEFTEEGKPAGMVIAHVASYYFYNLPLYFSQLSGVITLFAACGTLARLQRHNEVTAVLASGTSLYRLAAPIILAGLVMNILLWLDHEMILPQVAPKLARQRDDVEGARVYQIWCVRDGENRLLSAQQFSPRDKMVGGLIIMELSDNPAAPGQIEAVVTADRAEWDGQNRGWKLVQRGVRIRRSSGVSEGLSTEDRLVFAPVRFYPSELSPEDLLLRKTAQWLHFLSLGDLKRLEQRGDTSPVQIAQVRHARFTLPISNMILLLLGMAFFMNRLPESVLTQGAKALGTCGVAFLASFIGQQVVGSVEGFSLALPHWLPIFAFGPVAVVLLDNVKT